MGKGTLILVLGLSTLLSVMALSLNDNTGRGLDTTIDFYKATQARLIANSGVEIYLEKLRRNKTLYGTFDNNTLLKGKYNLNISGPDSLLTINSNASFEGFSHQTIVKAKRTPVGIPDITSAIYVSVENLSLQLNGNIDINGNDRNMDGTPGAGAPVPGIGVDNPADSTFIVNDVKNKISHAIQGLGGSPSVRTVNNTTDWLALTENYIFAADYTLPTGSYSSGDFGTVSEPKITYANGDVHFSGSAGGYGILVVNGNVTLSGNFTFRGIVIAYGQSSIETKTVGNAGIYGAAIFIGDNIDIQATGNAKFYYSSQAINNAKDNIKSSRFDIISWWE